MGAGTVEEAIARIRSECRDNDEIEYLVNFIRTSKKGIALPRHRDGIKGDMNDGEEK